MASAPSPNHSEQREQNTLCIQHHTPVQHSAIAFMGISHGQGFIIITQTEPILVSQPLQFLKKTSMQMKNSFIML